MHNQCIVKTTNQMDPEPSQQVYIVKFTEVDSPNIMMENQCTSLLSRHHA